MADAVVIVRLPLNSCWSGPTPLAGVAIVAVPEVARVVSLWPAPRRWHHPQRV